MVAIGDALGMPGHDLTAEQIKNRFKGILKTFQPAPENSRVHNGFKPGQITDDTILTLSVVRAYTESNGRISPRIIAEQTAEAVKKYSALGADKMFGPSTRSAVEKFLAGCDPERMSIEENHPMTGSSNGAAMKISPVGLVHPGNPDRVLEDTLAVCLPSHATQTGIAAAAAIAFGVAAAMRPGADVFSVFKAAVKGAEKGDALGRERARTVALPSVPEKIKLAVSLAVRAKSVSEGGRLFADIIGTGLPAYESIPTAIGIFVVCGGDPEQCVITGANVGYDTDTIASMAGGMAGAFKGFGAVPNDLFRKVQEVNNLDLEKIAADLQQVINV